MTHNAHFLCSPCAPRNLHHSRVWFLWTPLPMTRSHPCLFQVGGSLPLVQPAVVLDMDGRVSTGYIMLVGIGDKWVLEKRVKSLWGRLNSHLQSQKINLWMQFRRPLKRNLTPLRSLSNLAGFITACSSPALRPMWSYSATEPSWPIAGVFITDAWASCGEPSCKLQQSQSSLASFCNKMGTSIQDSFPSPPHWCSLRGWETHSRLLLLLAKQILT